MKVAIADDDPIVCSSLATILAATGAAEVPWTANSGEAAMSKYDENAPDMLLIDVQMPGMDGLTASERILHAHPDARILVLTTFADEAYIAKAMEIGTKGYLIKQDVSSVIPAVQAIMAGQIVMGAEVLAKLRFANGTAPTAARPNEPQDSGCMDAPDRFAHLTDRERDVVELVADGLDNREIAAKLFLSEGTVRNRISDILAKTNISNRTKLAVEWLAGH